MLKGDENSDDEMEPEGEDEDEDFVKGEDANSERLST